MTDRLTIFDEAAPVARAAVIARHDIDAGAVLVVDESEVADG